MNLYRVVVCFSFLIISSNLAAVSPVITGHPVIDRPPLLNWGTDIPVVSPDLTEPTANQVLDLHAQFSDCDIALSTAGNYHMALRVLWHRVYLPALQTAGMSVKNWMYTTSPPISPEQIAAKHVGFGNVQVACVPQVAVGPGSLMDKLRGINPPGPDMTDGSAPVPIIRNQGNVILVKKGNPKNILSVWDLGRKAVRVVTSNPDTEPGSFGNYSQSIYNIAAMDTNRPAWLPVTATADDLYHRIFNNSLLVPNKWLSGARIHHREVPWSITHGQADAGLMFYHLARYVTQRFPNRFEIVPLGGTVAAPVPLPGNRVATLFAVPISAAYAPGGVWSSEQLFATAELMYAYRSQAFADILLRYGMVQPAIP